MRVIVGVDTKGAYKSATRLFGRLGSSNAAVTLLNVASPVMPYLPPEASDGVLQTEYRTMVENAGRQALDEATDVACQLDLHARTKLVFGLPASALMDEVTAQHADLVVAAATHQGIWSSSFLGSVCRALAIGCPASVLVSKGDQPNGGSIKAVFATDHSPFSDRCLDKFLAMGLKGIREIQVVSAYSVSDAEASILSKNLASLGGDVDRWLAEQTDAKNEAVCAKLRAAGYIATSKTMACSPIDGIREAMRTSKSDLLIVGSHGKGFIERTFIGSVSLHQVVAEPYPVLVIRP